MASSNSEVFKCSVIKWTITSVSVCDLKLWPLLIKCFFNIVEFSIIPLWTTDTLWEEWGWAFKLFGIPWVAHLTCPIPIFPFKFFKSKLFSKLSTLPSDFTSLISPPESVAIPAESYPLYSNFFKELIIFAETGLLLDITIIPQINYFFFLL